jgi:hypothetical protein
MIRYAKVNDIPSVIEMLVDFSKATPVEFLKHAQYNPKLVQFALLNVMRSGLILLSERDDQITGMLIAQVVNDQWMPHLRYLKELAWWVKPEYRNSTDGYRLLAEYNRIGRAQLEAKRVTAIQLTTLANKPIPGIEKMGWKAVEQNFVMEL